MNSVILRYIYLRHSKAYSYSGHNSRDNRELRGGIWGPVKALKHAVDIQRILGFRVLGFGTPLPWV